MKLGVIGAGMIVREFLPHIMKIEGIEVHSILGTLRSREKVQALCEELQVPHAVFSFEDLLQTGIDTVYIAPPNDLHFSYAKRVLSEGLHAIVEKPFVSNCRELEELKQIAKEKQCFLLEAITTIHMDAFRKAREWMPLIGDVKLAICNFSRYSSRYEAFLAGEAHPVFSAERAGGSLADINVYNLHYIMGLFGEPLTYRYYADVEQGVDVGGTIMLDYGGFQAVCAATKCCAAPPYYMIEGTKGYIRAEDHLNGVGGMTVHLNDGYEETFTDPYGDARVIPEFICFREIIEKKLYDEAESLLEASEKVLEVMTQCRLQAGVQFPADQQF